MAVVVAVACGSVALWLWLLLLWRWLGWRLLWLGGWVDEATWSEQATEVDATSILCIDRGPYR